jgi:hypothetical protein
MQLMISLICVKVSELWNSNAISENTNKVLARARFQPDTYVICIWITLNTVYINHLFCSRMAAGTAVLQQKGYIRYRSQGDRRATADTDQRWQ